MEVGLWTALVVMAVTALGLKLLTKLVEGSASRHWPPGPWKFPIVGNLLQLSKQGELLHVTMGRLARAHGEVMRVWFGGWRPVIVVSSGQAAWEVFVNRASDYAARSVTFSDKVSAPGNPPIFGSTSGAYWHSLRRGLQGGALGPLHVSAQSRLHEDDMASMVRAMHEEADANGVARPLPHIRHAVLRLLSRLCFGPSFDDLKFAKAMADVVEEFSLQTNHGTLSDIFPFLRRLSWLLDRSYREADRMKRRILELLRPILSSKTLTPNSYAHFLLSQNVPLDAAAFLVFEVLLLGLDSTANTTAWALLFLTLNPGIQEKLHEEIRGLCSKNGSKTVKSENVSKLPYLQAVVRETLRMKPIAPLVPRMTVNETTLTGKKVPKGVEIFVNLYAIHYDPELWPEPHLFMPERFLPSSSSKTSGKKGVVEGEDVDGGDDLAMVMNKSFLPFGGGMRACAGMEVGKLQVALAVANLVNAFQWSKAEAADGQNPSEEHLSFVLMMKNPLAARITPRFNV